MCVTQIHSLLEYIAYFKKKENVFILNACGYRICTESVRKVRVRFDEHRHQSLGESLLLPEDEGSLIGEPSSAPLICAGFSSDEIGSV